MLSLKELGINIVDSHTHSGGTDTYNYFIGNTPHTQAVGDLALKASLAEVDKVITTPFPGSSYYDARILVEEGRREPSGLQDFPYQKENLVLVSDCKRIGEMFIPFACIDPIHKVREQIDFLSDLHDKEQIFGLKFHSLACGCRATELRNSGVIEFAISRNLPILIHSGINSLSHPRHIIDLGREFPSLRVCIAHLAGLDQEVINDVSKYENIFIDCAPFLQICRAVKEKSEIVSFPNLIDPENPTQSLLRYFRALEDHLIWGTDEPWTTSINVSGKVRSKNTYFDEVQVLTDILKISPGTVAAITNRNTYIYLFG